MVIHSQTLNSGWLTTYVTETITNIITKHRSPNKLTAITVKNMSGSEPGLKVLSRTLRECHHPYIYGNAISEERDATHFLGPMRRHLNEGTLSVSNLQNHSKWVESIADRQSQN